MTYGGYRIDDVVVWMMTWQVTSAKGQREGGKLFFPHRFGIGWFWAEGQRTTSTVDAWHLYKRKTTISLGGKVRWKDGLRNGSPPSDERQLI